MNMKHTMLPTRGSVPGTGTGRGTSAPPPQPTPVYHVGLPSDEELFDQQMKESEVTYANTTAATVASSSTMTDEMFNAQLQKRDAINKLVMLREPMVKSVTIDGQVFRFRLVTPHDSAKIIASLQDIPENERIAKARLLALCAVIMDVDGIKVEDIYSGSPEQNDPFWMRYWEISQWPSLLVNMLFNAMDQFAEVTDKRYSDSFLK